MSGLHRSGDRRPDRRAWPFGLIQAGKWARLMDGTESRVQGTRRSAQTREEPGKSTAPGPGRREWRILAVVLVGSFMAVLDTTIVNVALPSIAQGLKASSDALEWVVSGYALTFGLALVPAGRLGDRFGYKQVFLAGLTVFTLASVACGYRRTRPS
jgi:sugar phosphate permease